MKEFEGSISSRWLDESMKYLPLGKTLKILDVGTGTGFFGLLLSELGHHVVGMDLSFEMINKVAKCLGEEIGSKADFKGMNVEKLDFLNELFYVVILRNLTWI